MQIFLKYKLKAIQRPKKSGSSIIVTKTLKTVPWTCKSVSAVKYSHYSAILMADHMMNKYLSCTFLLI
jgi:hypothetical protein